MVIYMVGSAKARAMHLALEDAAQSYEIIG